MTNTNAYVFASSLLRAKEKSGSPAKSLESFINSPTLDALWQNAAAAFNLSTGEKGESLLNLAMAEAVRDLREATPDFKVFAPLLYKYDCTNIKLCIKAEIMGIDPRDMLFSCGSISCDDMLKAFSKKDYGILPENMKQAAEKAIELYRKSGEARLIDLTLDQACYRDMIDGIADAPELIRAIVTLRADATNLLTAMRIKDSGMETEAAVSLLERSLVCGGEIPSDLFYDANGIKGLEEICDKCAGKLIYETLKKITRSASLSLLDVERLFSDAALSLLKPVKFISYGPEIAIHYLLVREAEILNIRIIAAALAGHINTEDIRERVSVAYV